MKKQRARWLAVVVGRKRQTELADVGLVGSAQPRHCPSGSTPQSPMSIPAIQEAWLKHKESLICGLINMELTAGLRQDGQLIFGMEGIRDSPKDVQRRPDQRMGAYWVIS